MLLDGIVHHDRGVTQAMTVTFIQSDGGRAAAGFKGKTSDCAVRALAIGAEMPYKQALAILSDQQSTWAYSSRSKAAKHTKDQGTSAACGTMIKPFRIVMKNLGWQWTPTMHIGSGCVVHLKASELPSGHIICNLSRHLVCVIDGVIYDSYDCSRNGSRCVYGYRKRPVLQIVKR